MFYLKMLKNKCAKYLFILLPFIVSAKSLFDCYSNSNWSLEYFAQYFMSHLPFVGKWLMETLGNSQLLTVHLVNINQDISKYMFIGALGAFFSNIFYDLFLDFWSSYNLNIFSMNESPTSDSDSELEAEVLAEALAEAEAEAARAEAESGSDSEMDPERDQGTDAEADAEAESEAESDADAYANAFEPYSDSDSDPENDLIPSGTTWIWPEHFELPGGSWSVTGPGPWPGSIYITKD